jgi:hypothetical protein
MDHRLSLRQLASFLPEARFNAWIWQVFWLVPAKNTFPVAQWLCHFLHLPDGKQNLQQRGLPRIYTGFPFHLPV